jgi:hypothetical protein
LSFKGTPCINIIIIWAIGGKGGMVFLIGEKGEKERKTIIAPASFPHVVFMGIIKRWESFGFHDCPLWVFNGMSETFSTILT